MIRRAYGFIVRILNELSWLGPTLARLAVGVTFIATGWGKLHDLAKVTDFFRELHIPAPGFNAALVANVEFFGGILLLIGLATRLAALPLAFSMVIAIITAKLPNAEGAIEVFGFEEVMYFVLFVWLAVNGPGPLSLDHLICRSTSGKKPA